MTTALLRRNGTPTLSPFHEIDRLMNLNLPLPRGMGAPWPALDAWEDEEAVHVELDLPGVRPEDVNVTFHEGLLTIEGERAGREEGHALRERPRGRFRRTLRLRTDIQPDRIQASFENGVLSLLLPRAEASRPRKIEVKAR